MNYTKLITIILLAFTLTNCGTIFKGKSSLVKVSIGTPPNARIYYKDNFIGVPPCEFEVSKRGLKSGKQKVLIKSDGYKDEVVTLDGKLRVLPLIGNALIFFGAPAIIDLLSGHFWEVKSPVSYYLEKQNQSSSNVNLTNKKDSVDDQSNSTSSAHELVKLQILNEEGILTNSEFSALRLQIAEGKYNTGNSKADELNKLKKLHDSNILTKAELMTIKQKILSESYNYENSIYLKILKFVDLKDKGLINDSEFSIKKKEAVGGN
ncbi:MAG: SHOCT domain-containing protein [Bacteroidia bacterium]